MSPKSDEEIVGKIQQGESVLFGEIIDRYQRRLGGLVRKIVGKSEEVEDLVEETLVAAYENIQEFDTKKSFCGWILRIAHNKTVDFIKRKRPTSLPEDWDEASREKLLEEAEIEAEEKRKLSQALGKLELKYREVLVLFYFEEKSYEEISEILHTTTSNVGVMIKRAKEKLKKLYE